MEHIKGHDHYLDPPLLHTRCECDRCHDMFDCDDLNQVNLNWYCNECYDYLLAEEQEREQLSNFATKNRILV